MTSKNVIKADMALLGIKAADLVTYCRSKGIQASRASISLALKSDEMPYLVKTRAAIFEYIDMKKKEQNNGRIESTAMRD